MKLSPTLIEEIKRAYSEAKKQAEAYEAVLRANDALPATGNGNGNGNGQAQVIYQIPVSFPSRLLKLIGECPDGLTRREIIAQLQAAGVSLGGKSDLGHRVSVELNMLKNKKKQLKQVGDKYKLA